MAAFVLILEDLWNGLHRLYFDSGSFKEKKFFSIKVFINSINFLLSNILFILYPVQQNSHKNSSWISSIEGYLYPVLYSVLIAKSVDLLTDTIFLKIITTVEGFFNCTLRHGKIWGSLNKTQHSREEYVYSVLHKGKICVSPSPTIHKHSWMCHIHGRILILCTTTWQNLCIS